MNSIHLSIEITNEDFLRFREFFYRKTGIFYEESKRYFVDKRLRERIRIAECDSFLSYLALLRLQGEEFQALINEMTVNETYFFREDYQFKCLVNSILNEVVTRKRKGDVLRIWSAPCSSGEEPYSLAIYLLEYWPKVDEYNIEIIASDIDTRMIESASKGIFDKRSIQNLPSHLLKKYFLPRPNDGYQIVNDLRSSIEFAQLNIMDPDQVRPYRGFDVIFCRNLLIYFDDLSRRRAAETLFEALVPGGFICLGHSESMSRISPLYKIRKFPDAIVYQRPFK